MRGKNEEGTFQSPFSPYKWGDAFTEGNSWHYTWSVFQDVEGLKQLMGGDDSFVAMLDSVFVVPPVFDDSYYGFTIHEIREMQIAGMGNYAHGNQPIQHMIYLYNYTNQPWKTQKHVREVLTKLYTPQADGYCGDEDNGQTSAWYVFSSMGFYPVCPGSGEYVFGAPLFSKITLQLENGKQFEIDAANNSRENFYVSDISLNGNPWDKNYITHEALLQGGNLSFTMANQHDKTRGTDKESWPYSMSK
jgi:predicted alpha-1,2-mannosidase